MNSQEFKKLKYIIMFLLFSLGGIEYFSSQQYWKSIIFVIIFIFYISTSKLKIHRYFVLTIIYLSFIFGMQTVLFGAGDIINFGLIFLIVAIPYFGWKIYREKFVDFFVGVIVFFGIISLIFYSIQTISPEFYEFTRTLAPMLGTDPNEIEQNSFIIYTFEDAKVLDGMVLRNPGPFWEPSVFASFLIVALFLNTVKHGRINDWKNAIIIICILTTFSTAGYLSLIVLSGFYVYSKQNNQLARFIVFPLILIGGVYAYYSLDFLGEKIDSQYTYQTSVSLNVATSGRFLGARKSIEAMINNPISGRGLVTATMADSFSEEAGGYGVLNLGSRIGPLGLLLYLYFLFLFLRGFCVKNNYNPSFAIWGFMAFLVVMFGQGSYDKPIYILMVFAGMEYLRKENTTDKIIKLGA